MEIRALFLEVFNANGVTKVWKYFIYFFGGIYMYVLAVQYNFLWIFGKSPDLEQLENPKMDTPSEMYSADGILIGKYYKENRSPVDYNLIPVKVIKTLTATEDVRFYKHSGVDPKAFASIFISLAKGDNRGGSTISQQLAKNLFKTRRGASKGLIGHIPGINTIVAKTKEWITAIKLERMYTKNEILTMYLNTVDFGSNSFGIKAASKTFFNKSLEQLDTQEIAMLVGLLKAPTYYSPRLKPKNAIKRRNTVLAQMAKYKVITEKEKDSLKKENLVIRYTVEKQYEGPGTYFRGVMNNFLKNWCEDNGYDLYSDGLRVYTTIDSRVQKHAEDAVQVHMKELQKRFDRHWEGQGEAWRDKNGVVIPHFIEDYVPKTPIYKKLKREIGNDENKIWAELRKPKKMTVFTWNGDKDTVLSSIDSIKYYKTFLHTGFLCVDPFSGHIKAWVGGINYKYFKYDHVKQSMRQPGSTFKPFIYCAAIDSFGMAPCDKMIDQRMVYTYHEKSKRTGKDTVVEWSPRNSDWKVSGSEMSLRRAMAKSINTISAQLIQKIGNGSVVDGGKTVIAYAKKMGVKSPLEEVPSVGLGSSDVTLYEMVGAYGTFLNRGLYTEPVFITRIEDRNGNIIKEFIPERRQALSQESAFLMLHMLKGGLEEIGGTSQGLFQFDLFRGNEFGGKTGTSSNNSDGWFMGVTKDWVCGAWVGADDRSIHFRTGILGEGARTALPIYGHFMERVYGDKTIGITMGYFPKPKIKITKEYQCTWRPPKMPDSTMVNMYDSLPESALSPDEQFDGESSTP